MKVAFLIVLGWYLLLSLFSFLQYGWDKLAATRNTRRVPEKQLRQLDWLGGWPGGLLAQKVFKHKRRKRDYMLRFWLVVATHAALWTTIVAVWTFTRDTAA